MIMKVRLGATAAALSLLAFSFGAHAQGASPFAKAEDAIKYRQSALFMMSQHFGRLGAMAGDKVPYDATVAVANAELVSTLSHLPWAGFGPGTEGGKAKPEIWKEEASFKEKQEKLMAETTKLVVAAKTGSLDELKKQVGATGAACKSCHDAFRNR